MANKSSKCQEAYYSTYKAQNKQAKNRKLKLERLLRKDPENQLLLEALSNVKYRRKTPVNPVWSASTRRLAVVLKSFIGYFDPDILSSNPKVSGEALQKLRSRRDVPKQADYSAQAKAMYSILARARIKQL